MDLDLMTVAAEKYLRRAHEAEAEVERLHERNEELDLMRRGEIERLREALREMHEAIGDVRVTGMNARVMRLVEACKRAQELEDT